jgi:hypothetical protein
MWKWLDTWYLVASHVLGNTSLRCVVFGKYSKLPQKLSSWNHFCWQFKIYSWSQCSFHKINHFSRVPSVDTSLRDFELECNIIVELKSQQREGCALFMNMYKMYIFIKRSRRRNQRFPKLPAKRKRKNVKLKVDRVKTWCLRHEAEKGEQLKRMRLWNLPQTGLSHDADEPRMKQDCVFCPVSWCSWYAAALRMTVSVGFIILRPVSI